MSPLLDLHTHTVASGHAYSTVQEMAHAAAERGLQILGITDHAPSIPGAPDSIYFRNLHVVPRMMYGVRLLMGVELNILDTTGRLDLDEHHYSMLDLRIAGIHSLCWQGGTREQNTEGMLTAINNPWVHIISHPGDGTAEMLFEPIVQAARDTCTLLEINASSMKPCRHKDVARPNNLEILHLCRKYDVPVILGSDAHISFSVADYDYALPLLEEADFPDELVMNYWPQLCMDYLHIPTQEQEK
ncbi:MAG: phosphatase [Bacteroidaceae bacterium]|nr:phosphatase [Bacteroidaceae bacterium]